MEWQLSLQLEHTLLLTCIEIFLQTIAHWHVFLPCEDGVCELRQEQCLFMLLAYHSMDVAWMNSV